MATLDQPIATVFDKNAEALVLENDKQMLLERNGSTKPVTAETLTFWADNQASYRDHAGGHARSVGEW